MNPTKELAFQLLVLKAVQDIARAAVMPVRTAAQDALENGDRLSVTSPLDGTDIGHVLRTKPKPVAEITDRAALEAWCREHYPALLEQRRGIAPWNMNEALDVLAEHAPHLITVEHDVVPERVMASILAASLAAGAPMGPTGEADVPGVTVERPPGAITVRLADDGLDAVRALFTAGLITVDGTIRPELEGDTP